MDSTCGCQLSMRRGVEMLCRMVGGRLERSSDEGFPKEGDLQTSVEENIGQLLGLGFMVTE